MAECSKRQQLLEALKGVQGPLLVVGDFNDVPTGGAYKLMIDQFSDAWADAKRIWKV
jgi:endonuclease/exonuclease/phosphatase (EEP) superfamily protein YafD